MWSSFAGVSKPSGNMCRWFVNVHYSNRSQLVTASNKVSTIDFMEWYFTVHSRYAGTLAAEDYIQSSDLWCIIQGYAKDNPMVFLQYTSGRLTYWLKKNLHLPELLCRFRSKNCWPYYLITPIQFVSKPITSSNVTPRFTVYTRCFVNSSHVYCWSCSSESFYFFRIVCSERQPRSAPLAFISFSQSASSIINRCFNPLELRKYATNTRINKRATFVRLATHVSCSH